MSQCQCSIIIRAFNEERHIARLLTGIRQQQHVDAEIILVDSGSTDATVAISEQFGVKVVSIAPEEFTFGRALNLGCDHATSDLLVMASAHVYPLYCDWLSQLLQPFKNSTTGLTYGRQVGNELTRVSEHRIFARWFPNQSDGNQQDPFCNNANAAVRKELWEKYRYDETLTGLEDLDFAKRILKNGHSVSYVAEAQIVHVHEETALSIYNRYRREAIAMRQILPAERMSFVDLVRLLVSNIVSDCFYAFREKQLLRNLFDIPMFRTMQLIGAYRGFRQTGPVSAALRRRFYYPNQTYAVEQRSRIKQQPVNYSSDLGSTSNLSGQA